MYHWYLLVRQQLKNDILFRKSGNLIYRDESELPGKSPISPLKLFWIGALEILPLIAGVVLFKSFRPIVVDYDYVVLGILASLFIAYIFRKSIPDQPIKLSY